MLWKKFEKINKKCRHIAKTVMIYLFFVCSALTYLRINVINKIIFVRSTALISSRRCSDEADIEKFTSITIYSNCVFLPIFDSAPPRNVQRVNDKIQTMLIEVHSCRA